MWCVCTGLGSLWLVPKQCVVFFSPALDACVCDGALDCFGGRTAHSRWRALALVFVFLQGTSAECGVSELVWVHRGWV